MGTKTAKGKRVASDNAPFQVKVKSYPQRKIIHGAEGRNPGKTLCGYGIDTRKMDLEFDPEADNACQRCNLILEAREAEVW